MKNQKIKSTSVQVIKHIFTWFTVAILIIISLSVFFFLINLKNWIVYDLILDNLPEEYLGLLDFFKRVIGSGLFLVELFYFCVASSIFYFFIYIGDCIDKVRNRFEEIYKKFLCPNCHSKDVTKFLVIRISQLNYNRLRAELAIDVGENDKVIELKGRINDSTFEKKTLDELYKNCYYVKFRCNICGKEFGAIHHYRKFK